MDIKLKARLNAQVSAINVQGDSPTPPTPGERDIFLHRLYLSTQPTYFGYMYLDYWTKREDAFTTAAELKQDMIDTYGEDSPVLAFGIWAEKTETMPFNMFIHQIGVMDGALCAVGLNSEHSEGDNVMAYGILPEDAIRVTDTVL